MAARSKTRAERNISWIETYCRVPEGRTVGQPVKLRPWQRDIILGIYDQPTRRAIISLGRKNGKTALAAFLLLLHLCGPEAPPNSQLYSAAQSREQAAILFALAAKMVRMSPDLNGVVVVRDTAKQLFCGELGTLYRALSADATTAYGLSPCFIVHDELGQVKGSRSELYEALETATAAQENPLSVVISTQAPTEADLLSVLIDDAQKKGDPRVRLFLYTSDEAADPFEIDTIRQANPAFGDFQNAEEVLAMAEDARRMPSREAEYRNLVLNQRVEMYNPFVSKGVWLSCGDPVLESFGDLPVYGGLDLSATSDLTALVLIAPHEGQWHTSSRRSGCQRRGCGSVRDRIGSNTTCGTLRAFSPRRRARASITVRRRVRARSVRQARSQTGRFRPMGLGSLPQVAREGSIQRIRA
jgi:phage terminase large subunit-like protein